MKYLISLFAIFLMMSVVACSTDPENPPTFRVRNDRATDASLQVKTSAGNTININNVQPSTTSDYQGVATGQVDITVTTKGLSDPYTASFLAQINQSYTVVVANTTPTAINVISP